MSVTKPAQRKPYTPTASGIMVASPAQHSAPVIVIKPATAQASNNQPGAPIKRADSAEVIKIPEPIIEPITIIVASIGPRARTRLVWTFVGEAVGFARTTSSSPTVAPLSTLSLIVELETARPRAEEILFCA